MTGPYTEEFLESLGAHVSGLAARWGLSPKTRARVLNISENVIFRLDDPEAGAPIVVRVHRPGYHSATEIAAEIAWIEALRDAGTVETPAIVPCADGSRVTCFEHGGEPRRAVAFAWMTGKEPAADARLTETFGRLGATSARLHRHVRDWAPPPGFVRKRWTYESTIGPAPHWGDWRAAEGLDAPAIALLERLCERLRTRLAAYGEGADRFGLVHADLRLTNLLVEGDRLGVIDFDDCGFGWFAYDFAASISFHEHEPWIPDLQAAWLEGYAQVAPPPPEAEAILPHLIALRRLLLTAWITSHAETPTARELVAQGYARGAVELAERHLMRV
ncbi:MAG: phosphotransferase [Paracoccaceae bacterium]